MVRTRMPGAHALLAALCMQLCVASISSGATVSIDPTVTYRTIEGLGFCGPPAEMYKVRQGPFLVEAPWEPFAETLITYVGMTMSRGFDTRACDFNPSPGQYVVPPSLREELRKQRLLQHIADSCDEVYRFSPNVFSPAPWMKENNLCHKGEDPSTNKLKPEHYDDFASMCSAFVRICIDTFGVTPYAFSPQNEPAFPEPYASCVYTASSYAEMLRFVGPAVERASPTTLIYGVEHALWTFPSWEMTVLRDSEAEPYFDRFAFHGSTSDVDVDTSQWPALTRSYPRDKWMSEFNWHWKDYDTCFGQASSVINRLGDGANLTGYMAGGSCLWWDGVGGDKLNAFFMNAQIMRFVRPGMTRVKAASDEPLLRVIAFQNESRGSFSVVMINGRTDELQVTLTSTGAIPDSLEMRTTSSSQGFVEGPLQDGRSPIAVPARGIVSLGFRIRGPQPVDSQPIADRRSPVTSHERHVPAPEAVRVFDLRGRLVERSVRGPLTRRLPRTVLVEQNASGAVTIVPHGVRTRQ